MTYLDNGGSLYIEGADFCSANQQTSLLSYMGVASERSFGLNDTNTLLGQIGTFTDGLEISYRGDTSAHVRLDQLSPDGGTLLFWDENQLGRVVANVNNGYRTIVSSTIFNVLVDGEGNNTKAYLMNQYLAFMDPSLNDSTGAYLANHIEE